MTQRALRVAVTGGIGSGKSTVAALLGAAGAFTLNADALARDALALGTPGLAAVAAEFGTDILAPDGTLDRARLAEQVFSVPALRRRLEAIVHPEVARRAEEIFAAAQPGSVGVYEIPLLAEAGRGADFDVIVVVDVPEHVQRERLRRERGMSEADIDARLAAQASRTERLAIADYIIDNTGSPEELGARVDQVWQHLRRISQEL